MQFLYSFLNNNLKSDPEQLFNFNSRLDIINKTESGLLKISPFYNWTDQDLDTYMEKYKLVNEYDYFDPTKVDEKRECGLHNREGK